MLLFPLLGLVCGFAGWSGIFLLSGKGPLGIYFPGISLGIFLYLIGAYVAALPKGKSLLNLAILLLASVAGWSISSSLGRNLGGPGPFLAASTLGAFVPCMGMLLAWQIRKGGWLFTGMVTSSGALSAALFLSMREFFALSHYQFLWPLILLCLWQSLFFTSISLALRLPEPSLRA